MKNPKIAAKTVDVLMNINNFDFNIFELNELADRKTLHYVLYELFDRLEYFGSLIDENKYKNFIHNIIEGYNRHLPYHNDIHAADVLQTTYMFLEKGNLVQVINIFL
jgi:hypothetical protein